MGGTNIDWVIHRLNPFVASDAADAAGRKARAHAPKRAKYFAEREVQNNDGSFPFGEGFLYSGTQPQTRSANWLSGHGKPDATGEAGHRGTKHQQQDALGTLRTTVGGKDAAVLVAADGVSASGSLAARASKAAVEVFTRELSRALEHAPTNEARRHAHVEQAMTRAAFVANFEVIRQVLFDFESDGRFDAGDKTALRQRFGVELPVGKLTVAEMQRIAPRLDAAITALDERDRSALTTFAVAVAVDNDLYTFSSGDAVVGLFRPSRPAGKRLIHLTDRDQAVVELYRNDGDFGAHPDLYENVITDSIGDSAVLTGTIRRYPNLLEPGDRVVAASDGLGPRGPGRGLDRKAIETILADNPGPEAARALVKAQIADLEPDEYQDNVGVTVLTID